MYKKADIMFMYAETSVHVGGGESVGAIDLAIARERYTDFPYIPSSGVKGAIRDWFEKSQLPEDGDELTETLFGPEKEGSDHGGAAVFTDARTLLFPVRSLKGIYAWITCPLVLQRFKRDRGLATHSDNIFEIPDPKPGNFIASDNCENVINGKNIILEEYTLSKNESSSDISNLVKQIRSALPSTDVYQYWREKLETNLVILADDDFRDFVKSSTEVQARIRINSETKTVEEGGLFYQENLPSDTILYCVIATNDSFNKEYDKNAAELFSLLHTKVNGATVQLGGNESIGKGIFSFSFMNNNSGGEK